MAVGIRLWRSAAQFGDSQFGDTYNFTVLSDYVCWAAGQPGPAGKGLTLIMTRIMMGQSGLGPRCSVLPGLMGSRRNSLQSQTARSSYMRLFSGADPVRAAGWLSVCRAACLRLSASQSPSPSRLQGPAPWRSVAAAETNHWLFAPTIISKLCQRNLAANEQLDNDKNRQMITLWADTSQQEHSDLVRTWAKYTLHCAFTPTQVWSKRVTVQRRASYRTAARYSAGSNGAPPCPYLPEPRESAAGQPDLPGPRLSPV